MVDRRRLLLAPLLVSLAGAAPGTPLAAAVMQRLADLPSRSTRFVEEKRLRSLTAPLVSRGVLIFRKPAYLEKDTEAPKRERLVIDGNRLTLTEAGEAPHVVALEAHPVLRTFAGTLRAALTGNLEALSRFYTIEEQGTIAAWRLMLVPIAPALRESVARITLDGNEAQLRQIVIQEPNGDSDRLLLQ